MFGGIRGRLWRSAVASGGLVVVVVVSTAASLMVSGSPVQAAGYPSWQDVQDSKANTQAAAAKATEIQGIISSLEGQLRDAQTVAEQRGAELQRADDDLFEAAQRASELDGRAAASQAEADVASTQAGRLVAQLYRSGGSELSVSLLLDDRDSDELLFKLGSMSKLAERSNFIYMNATIAQNAANALGEQAKVAQTERESLRAAADAVLKKATAAADGLNAAFDASRSKIAELEAQLAALRATESATVDEYRKGLEERQRERDRIGGPGTGLPPNGEGWSIPASGPITDTFGEREIICSPGGCSNPFHRGTDIGTGCEAPIYAASNGTVVYAGFYYSYGNFILIDHGDGIQTGYAHILPGGIKVRNGQSVSAGDNIALSGTTGASTGCHLHFEVRLGGIATDPARFMASRGAPLG